jgi:hypothetical protein
MGSAAGVAAAFEAAFAGFGCEADAEGSFGAAAIADLDAVLGGTDAGIGVVECVTFGATEEIGKVKAVDGSFAAWWRPRTKYQPFAISAIATSTTSATSAVRLGLFATAAGVAVCCVGDTAVPTAAPYGAAPG